MSELSHASEKFELLNEIVRLRHRVAELDGEVQAQRNALSLAGVYASQGDREKVLEILCRINARDNVISEIDSLRARVAELEAALGRLLEEVDDLNGWKPTSLSSGGAAYDAALAALRRKEDSP